MNNEMRELSSEISEIPDFVREPRYFHFIASVGWGMSAATLAVIVPLALSNPENAAANIGAGILFVGIAAGLLTLAGMLVIGLPVSALLRAAKAEHRFLYAAIGAIAGVAATVMLFRMPLRFDEEFFWFSSIGGFAGFATALRWGRWREALARYRQRPTEAAPQRAKRSNPIHDLIH